MSAAVAEDLDPIEEILRCAVNPLYFTYHYCTVKDEETGRRAPFRLWDAQTAVLKLLWLFRFVILLKARQIGATTLVVAYAVWLGLFQPGATILIFSKTQKEAKDMLKRIKSVIRTLPVWLQPADFIVDATRELELPNGSRYLTFASRGPGGDSYTASLVIIDEADLIPNLNELLEGAEPTIGAGGKMILLSRASKKDNKSPFKALYRAAAAGLNDFQPAFIPWHARPGRTKEWYENEKRRIETRTGALDDLFAQYPATPEEALAPRELDRRFMSKHVLKVFVPTKPLPAGATPWPGLEGLRVYERPRPGITYVIGSDVAEGNPNSDDSVACVVEQATQKQVAILAAKLEPGELAHWLARLAQWYNGASVLIERNHHGSHCINAARTVPSSVAPRPRLLVGRDNKYGWWTDYQGKRRMYAQLADCIRCCSCLIVDQMTYDQLISLDAEELNAPEAQHDDCAIAYAIAIYACSTPTKKPDLKILSYRTDGTTEPEPDENAPPPNAKGPLSKVANVEWFPSSGEWWVRLEKDGERLDLFGAKEKLQAETAAAAAAEMLATEGPVAPPEANTVAALVFQMLRDQGWIRASQN